MASSPSPVPTARQPFRCLARRARPFRRRGDSADRRRSSAGETSATERAGQVVGANDDREDDDDEPMEVIEHEGFTYEKKWTASASDALPTGRCEWTLWACSERGCDGQLAVTPVRSKRWRWRRMAVYRRPGGRLAAMQTWRPHNHPATAPKDDSVTCVSKVLNDTNKLNSSETKSSSIHVKNINSIKDGDILKDADIPEQTIASDTEMFIVEKTKFLEPVSFNHIEDSKSIDIDINKSSSISNGDLVSLKCVNEKSDRSSHSKDSSLIETSREITSIGDQLVSQQCSTTNIIINKSNSKEDVNKNISAVCDSNVLKDIDDLNSDISCSMYSLDESKLIQCHICGPLFSIPDYGQHILTVEHKNASDQYFKDRIDFENHRLFSSFTHEILEFFNDVKKYFELLVDHLLLKHKKMLVNIHLYGLYHEESLNEESKNIAEVKHFDVDNKELTKDTNIHEFYENMVELFLFRNDVFTKSGWSLEELLFIEITIVKQLINGEQIISLNDCSHNKINDTNNIRKIEPLQLQLTLCKQCKMYIVNKNYQQHLESVSHQISQLYFQSQNIQVIKDQCDNCILGTRVISPNHDLINDFFETIHSYITELVHRVMFLLKHSNLNISLKLFALYQKNSNKKSDNLGEVKTFLIKDEILSGFTVLSNWFQNVSHKFKLYNQNYIISQDSLYLVRVMFLEVYFYKVTS